MSSISNHLPNFASFNPLSPNPEASNKTQFSSAALQVQQSSDITLFTEEGDKVTLSSAASFEARYATYSSQGLIDGNAFQGDAQAFSVSEAFAFELSVEGDLSKEELKDIKKALQTIEKLTTDFFSGKTDKALDRAERIAKLDSIASFEAVLQYSKSLSAQAAVTETAPAQAETSPQTPGIETPAAAPEALPLPEVLPKAEATDDAPPLSGPLLTSSTPSEPVNDLVGQMTDAVLASKIAPSKIADHLDAFLDSLFVKLARGEHMDLQDLKLARQVKAEFSFSLKETVAAEREASEDTPAVETLELDHREGAHGEV